MLTPLGVDASDPAGAAMGADRDAAVMGSWAGGRLFMAQRGFQVCRRLLFRDLAENDKAFGLRAGAFWAHRMKCGLDGPKRRRAICNRRA